ncbi:NAD(P)-binding protein [Nocardioides dongxiaopingii]|uniref:NAD(P)-binding protein n=1 Tax=Nocardioides dongxiaopingii TaxID=2576036 RepID=UPI0010C76CC1|nr:FAD/NAD(P)-binding protein [Nocardioides dongxiaopingii]
MTRRVEVDYLVVGAGATGMAFTDALVDHADVRVAILDRRPGVGGHWRAAYPFVQLHQASSFYGVASTVLGGGIQQEGPEAGLHERADRDTICAYYDRVLEERLLASGRVELFSGCEYRGDRTFTSLDTGERFEVPERCRVVDARYLAPDIPAESPRRFAVEDGVRVVPVNDLDAALEREPPGQHVVVGSGKTATDACIRLLASGTDPDRICWVRPRDPWMLNRAVVQPDPTVYLAMVADLLRAAGEATSLPGLFHALEDAGIMLRLDPSAEPTMAKAPTLGLWELERLRTIEDVVRLGHVDAVGHGRLDLRGGTVAIRPDALVVDCAADGLRRPPRVPIWGPGTITPQPVRAGFPCFGAALVGYVEATRGDDEEKNRLCPPTSYGDSLADWAEMNVLGMRGAASFGAEPDIREWADSVALNPARVPPGLSGSAEVVAVQERIGAHAPRGLARLAALAGLTP